MNLEEEAAQRLAKLHCIGAGQIDRVGVDSPEGQVADCARPASLLGHDPRGADTHARHVLDGGERQDQRVAAPAHLVGLLPQELLVRHGRLVWPPVDRGLKLLRREGRRRGVNWGAEASQVLKVACCVMR